MKGFFLLIIANIFCLACFSQVDTISIKKNNLQIIYLKEGSSKYLNWVKDTKSGLISSISISERNIYFKKINGKEVIVVEQRKFNNDTSNIKFIYTVSDRSTFKTLYDYTKRSGVIEAYNYQGNEIKGADTVKQNTKRTFSLKFNDLPYCLELDQETLTALPLKRTGQKMAVSFYQPGRKGGPKFQTVDVIGEEQLASVNNDKVDCWVIKLPFDSENYDLLWITKFSHECLKLESNSPTDTFYRVKLFNTNLIF